MRSDDITPLGFTDNRLDRCTQMRCDEAWLKQQQDNPQGRYLPLFKGSPLASAVAGSHEKAKLVWLDKSQSARLPIKEETLILLGTCNATPHFTIDVSDLGEGQDRLLEKYGSFIPLIAAGFQLEADELALAGQAMWMLNWHRKNNFSAEDGSATKLAAGGAKRIDLHGTEFFPRINPVVLTLVTYDDQCLLARSPHFPPDFYSALAGFVEVGENLEECAKREVFEEVGVGISDLHYVASQPWPLSQSLMIGFIAQTNNPTLKIDQTEIDDAKWISKMAVCDHLTTPSQGNIILPPSFTLARLLIEHWAMR